MKKFEEIIAEMQNPSNPSVCPWFAGRLDVAHKREVDALKRRCAELDAEIAAKDEVIKRLNDAISEEQRRKMATAEKSSAVGDAAKLREAVIETQSIIVKCMDILNRIPECGYNALIDDVAEELCELREQCVKPALAAPPRNCDVGTSDEQSERFENFCLKHIGCAEEMGGRHCVGCPLEKASRHITQKCELYWAQMPYESEAGK